MDKEDCPQLKIHIRSKNNRKPKPEASQTSPTDKKNFNQGFPKIPHSLQQKSLQFKLGNSCKYLTFVHLKKHTKARNFPTLTKAIYLVIRQKTNERSRQRQELKRQFPHS
jgi:hypothetical protein